MKIEQALTACRAGGGPAAGGMQPGAVPYDYDLSAYIELGTYSAIPYLPYGDTGRDTVEPMTW